MILFFKQLNTHKLGKMTKPINDKQYKITFEKLKIKYSIQYNQTQKLDS